MIIWSEQGSRDYRRNEVMIAGRALIQSSRRVGTMKEVIQGAVGLLKQGQPCVLATVVRTKGSTPQKPGAMLLVRQDGTGEGTLGGGCVEGDIWFAAQEQRRD